MPENIACFTRLTYSERCEIERSLDAGISIAEIARRLSRSASSIAREIKRNRRDDGYRAHPTSMTRFCIHVKGCEVKGLCNNTETISARAA